ncbi:MAG: nucleoside deaminase [Victivallaceae bacterium]|nr:nucleoside deaminase [Victivallaceae bacterium]
MKVVSLCVLLCLLAAGGTMAGEAARGRIGDDKLVDAILIPEWLRKLETTDCGREIKGDEAQLRYVIRLATENVRRKTGGPFAAAVFESKTGRLVALGVNVVVPSHQSWTHAEMTAIGNAQSLIGRHSLDGYVLVSSCEPCAMCTGAIPWSGVDRVVYGSPREMPEAVGFDEGYKGEDWRGNMEKRHVVIVGPMLEEESRAPFDLYEKTKGVIY